MTRAGTSHRRVIRRATGDHLERALSPLSGASRSFIMLVASVNELVVIF